MGGIIAAILVLARAPRREARDGRKIWQFCLDLCASSDAREQSKTCSLFAAPRPLHYYARLLRRQHVEPPRRNHPRGAKVHSLGAREPARIH